MDLLVGRANERHLGSALPEQSLRRAKLRVVLVDGRGVLRDGLKQLIHGEVDMEVVGEAEEPKSAVELAMTTKADVVVIALSLGSADGVDAIRELAKRCPESRVLVLTLQEDHSHVREMLQAGASGYLVKRATGEEFINAIRAVVTKGLFVDPRIEAALLADASGRPVGQTRLHAELSERETEVMQLVARGFTTKEVSAKLGVSAKTVETYKARSMGKLGLRSRVDIVRLATDRGWLSGP